MLDSIYGPAKTLTAILIAESGLHAVTPEQYCEDKAARSGSSFYYSFLFLPPEQRQAIIALYAFCREVDDVVDEAVEPEIARTKLNWWREEISRVFNGNPQHPVGKALYIPVNSFNLPAEHFLEIIDGMEMDLDYQSYPTFKELTLYCHRVASIVGIMSAEIFGYQDRRTLKYAHNLGMAFQLTNILRDIREDRQRGRVYIPLDELAKFRIDLNDLNLNQTSNELRALFQYQAQRIDAYYRQAFEFLPEVDRYSQRSGLIMAGIYRATLKKIVSDNYNVLEKRTTLTPMRKLWLAWKIMREEKRRHKLFQNEITH